MPVVKPPVKIPKPPGRFLWEGSGGIGPNGGVTQFAGECEGEGSMKRANNRLAQQKIGQKIFCGEGGGFSRRGEVVSFPFTGGG